MSLQNLTKRLGANWMDQRQTERQARETWKIYLRLSQEHKFPREEEKRKAGRWGSLKGVMQAGENDAKAPALRVILS